MQSMAIVILLFVSSHFYIKSQALEVSNEALWKDYLKGVSVKLDKPWYVKCVKDGKVVEATKETRSFKMNFGNAREGSLVVDYCIVSRSKSEDI